MTLVEKVLKALREEALRSPHEPWVQAPAVAKAIGVTAARTRTILNELWYERRVIRFSASRRHYYRAPS